MLLLNDHDGGPVYLVSMDVVIFEMRSGVAGAQYEAFDAIDL